MAPSPETPSLPSTPSPSSPPRIWHRIVSALALALLAAFAVYFGWPYFQLMVLAAAGLMAWEWNAICAGARADRTVLIAVTSAVLVALLGAAGHHQAALIAIAAGAALCGLTAVATGAGAAGWSALGPAYAGLPALAIVWLYAATANGPILVAWAIVVVAATDIGAYIAGRTIGGPRLAPRISPNKTWAGLGGGIAAAATASVLFVFALTINQVLSAVVASAIVAVIAQAGDLFESLMKRRFGVKDSSQLLPGHGGLLDRFDGLVAAVIALAAWHLIAATGGTPWR